MHILCQGILYATLVRLQEAKEVGVGYGEDLQGGRGRGAVVLGSSMRLSVWEEVKVNNIIDVDVQVFAIRKISDKKI